MNRFRINEPWIRFSGVLLFFAGACAGELSDEQKEARRGNSGGAATAEGGRIAGTGGAAGGGGGGLDLCVVPLMSRSCNVAGCHGANMPSAGLDLSQAVLTQPGSLVDKSNAGDAHGCLAGMFKLIDSREPEKSLLYRKVISPPVCGASMPIGVPLTAADVACISSWIRSIPGVGSGTSSGSGGGAGGGGSSDAGHG